MAKYVDANDLSNNPATRVPICICLDLSGSMNTVESGEIKQTGRQEYIDGKLYNIVEGGTSRLDELQKGLELLFKSIKEDDMAVDAAEVAIVSFADDAKKEMDFDHIENQELPLLEANGDKTAIGSGVILALQILEERKNLYKEAGVQYFQPWLVLMTDGENNKNQNALAEAIKKTEELTKGKKLSIFAIGIGKDADMEILAKLSPKRRPLRLQGIKFPEFFEWLSQSIARVSVSKTGEDVKLPPIDDWGTL